MGLRITTWNVNGIRNPFSYQPWRDKRSFVAMFDILEADIVILQETKIQRKDLRDDMVLVPGWDCYFSLPKYEKGKFGVVIYTRQSVCAPIRAEEGISGTLCSPNSPTSYKELPKAQQIGGYPEEDQARAAADAPECATDFAVLDSEGRCVILEFTAFVLVGVYNPATRDESRTAFRTGFLNLLDIRVRNLVAMGKRVILTGDLNISKLEIDVANCEVDLRKAGTTIEEYFSRPARRMFNQMVDDGVVWGPRDEARAEPVLHDICRGFHPDRKGMFTCWETKINARPGNYGSRIDYVLCSLDMRSWFCESNIQEGLMGSDHCPVYATLKETVQVAGEEVYIRDLMNPPGMFSNGCRVREYSAKDMQPLSGKLIPEFSGRRSIKDMFSKKPVSSQVTTPSRSISHSSAINGLHEPSNGDQDVTQEVTLPTAFTPQATQMGDQDIKQAGGTLEESSQSATKRSGPDASPKKAAKRLKPQTSKTALATTPKKGQQSLIGFFKPKIADSTLATVTNPDTASIHVADQLAKKLAASDEIHELLSENPATLPSSTAASVSIHPATPPSLSHEGVTKTDDTVYDPVQSKESWSKLFTKPASPLCEGHEEPCKVMTTKKPGPNCGRSFWICAKPLGPSGQKEKNTEWRCGTFIWCSDHRGV